MPHGSLFYLPFHAFRVRGTFLGDLYPLSYAPSATAYHLTRVREIGARTAEDALVVFPGEGDDELAHLAGRIAATMPRVSLVAGYDASDGTFEKSKYAGTV